MASRWNTIVAGVDASRAGKSALKQRGGPIYPDDMVGAPGNLPTTTGQTGKQAEIVRAVVSEIDATVSRQHRQLAARRSLQLVDAEL